MTYLLETKNLSVSYATQEGVHKALDGISFFIEQGKSLGIVGESGSGKTTLGSSILRLLPSNAKYDSGGIIYNGVDLLSISEKALRRVRGKDISIVFQDPLASLDPLFTIEYQIAETIKAHNHNIKKTEIDRLINSQLSDVGLPEPGNIKRLYPHELSGGMRQRVMIAIALVNHPLLLIADEPTTAVDVTIQAQILDLLKHAKIHYRLTLLLITHDLGITSELVDRLIVMYGGTIVEEGRTEDILSAPYHPYTKGLLMAIPELADIASNAPERLSAIPGSVRAHYDNYAGCRFYERCIYKTQECLDKEPQLTEYAPRHSARCIHPLYI